MPAILGLSPWRTAYDVWLEKTGKVDPIESTETMDIGNMIEDGLLDWAAAKLSLPITKNQYRVHQNAIHSASHDALVNGLPAGLEAKSTGRSDDWGEEGTDAVPDHVLIQCQQQMMVSGLERVHVPVLMGGGWGLQRKLYLVLRDSDIIEVIEREGVRFWREHVIAGVAPEGTPSLEVAKRIRREPQKVTVIADEIIADWRAALDAKNAADKLAKEKDAEILALLGDAEAADFGGGRLTYFEQTRKAHEVKESTFRVLRIAKAK